MAALWASGVEVTLANLSFADLPRFPPDTWIAPDVAAVTPIRPGPTDYFPERTLATWLASRGLEPQV